MQSALLISITAVYKYLEKEGVNNLVVGSKNVVKGNGNVVIGHSIAANGDDNWIIGNKKSSGEYENEFLDDLTKLVLLGLKVSSI